MAVRRCVVILLWLCAISASVQAAPSVDPSSLCEDIDPIFCIIESVKQYDPLLNRSPGPLPPVMITPDQIRRSQWKMCCGGNNGNSPQKNYDH